MIEHCWIATKADHEPRYVPAEHIANWERHGWTVVEYIPAATTHTHDQCEMSVIARSEADERRWTISKDDSWGEAGMAVEGPDTESVEVVPASQLQGAVGAIRAFIEAWDAWEADKAFEDPYPALKDAVEQMRHDLGGQ